MNIKLFLITGLLALGTLASNAQCAAYGYFTQSGATVSFHDTSYSVNSHYSYWSFGDGATSYSTNPSHTYSANGTYTACLEIHDSIARCTDTVCFTVTVSSYSTSCNASFTAAVDSANSMKYNFTNTSSGAATSYWWFGGSNSSRVTSPSFTFTTTGYKTVCLTTYDSSGNLCDSVCQSVYVRGSSSTSCDATFSYSVRGNTVSFYDSIGSGLDIIWDFGDSSTSFSSNPTHTYSSSGTYRVTLFLYVTDSSGNQVLCDSFSTAVVIGSSSSCTASFTSQVDSTNANKYHFYGSAPVAGGSSKWVVFSGAGSSAIYYTQNATYTFGSAGRYLVMYALFDSSGNQCDSTSAYITAGCQSSYYLAVDSANKYNLYIVNNSFGTNSSTTYLWTFGDGDSSTAQNPTHQYATYGAYNLCLTTSTTTRGVTCASTYCDTIGLDSNGNLLKKGGFSITVLNEGDLLNVPQNETLNGVNIYPNPSTGRYTVNVDMNSTEVMNIRAINSLGQEVLNKNVNVVSGSNELMLDLSDQNDGLYFIHMRAGNKLKNTKVYLVK